MLEHAPTSPSACRNITNKLFPINDPPDLRLTCSFTIAKTVFDGHGEYGMATSVFARDKVRVVCHLQKSLHLRNSNLKNLLRLWIVLRPNLFFTYQVTYT